ncbi:MAG: sulfotransferase [Streptosporangiales bacterium]|nr:sulfotransferase [Streptosporangiales bacterium]
MLQLMLHAHPRLAVPPETRFVERTYFARRTFGDLRDPDSRRRLAESIVRPADTRFAHLRLDADEVTERIVAAPPTVGSACAAVFEAYAERFGRPRWGDKRPGYHNVVPVLRRMFPDAVFVHLLRDGRDCVASLKRASWWRRSTYGSIVSWMDATRNAGHAARTLPSDAFHELRYEDLVADPPRVLAELCDFLGEDYDEAMTRPRDLAGVAVPTRKMRVEGTLRDVSTASIGNWRQVLDPWEVELCEAVMGDRLSGLGYELSGAARPDAAHRRRYLRAAAATRARRYRTLAADRLDLALHRPAIAASPVRPR